MLEAFMQCIIHEEEQNMTAVTKPINRMTTIKTRESAEFN